MILCVMRIPPSLDGHGGSQRAWFLLDALRRIAPVHFVLVTRPADLDGRVSLEPLRDFAVSATRIEIPEWMPSPVMRSAFFWRFSPRWVDLARFRSPEAPRLSKRALRRIAEQLPTRSVDAVFAGRLPSAVILDDMMTGGMVQAKRKVVDFDDIMSEFRTRQIAANRDNWKPQYRLVETIDAKVIRRSERSIATRWDAVSVCSDDDALKLGVAYPAASVVKVPNVVHRPRLPPPSVQPVVRVLFVGNLTHAPNTLGLRVFIEEGWPRVVEALGERVSFTIVGMNPNPAMLRLAASIGAPVHANVPSLDPYYLDSDIVIAPILFGGGTRIKILEAMAFGRPVVSTSVGAEGLALEPGRHAMIADGMEHFADAIIALARDRGRRLAMAAEARALQERSFDVSAISTAVSQMMNGHAA